MKKTDAFLPSISSSFHLFSSLHSFYGTIGQFIFVFPMKNGQLELFTLYLTLTTEQKKHSLDKTHKKNRMSF